MRQKLRRRQDKAPASTGGEGDLAALERRLREADLRSRLEQEIDEQRECEADLRCQWAALFSAHRDEMDELNREAAFLAAEVAAMREEKEVLAEKLRHEEGLAAVFERLQKIYSDTLPCVDNRLKR